MKFFKWLFLSVVFLSGMSLSCPAFAEGKAALTPPLEPELKAAAQREPARASKRRRKRRMKKRVTVDFGDELIEGSVSSPGIFHLFHKKELSYGRLIKFRKNFLPEMRRTARELK